VWAAAWAQLDYLKLPKYFTGIEIFLFNEQREIDVARIVKNSNKRRTNRDFPFQG